LRKEGPRKLKITKQASMCNEKVNPVKHGTQERKQGREVKLAETKFYVGICRQRRKVGGWEK